MKRLLAIMCLMLMIFAVGCSGEEALEEIKDQEQNAENLIDKVPGLEEGVQGELNKVD